MSGAVIIRFRSFRREPSAANMKASNRQKETHCYFFGNRHCMHIFVGFFRHRPSMDALYSVAETVVVKGRAMTACCVPALSAAHRLDSSALTLVDESRIHPDLKVTWEVLAKDIQMVMRRYGIEKPYERLKKLINGEFAAAY